MKDEMHNQSRFLFTQTAPLLIYLAPGKRVKNHTIYSIQDDKTYKRRIKRFAQNRFRLCMHGWLLMHPEDDDHLSLINPVSMERIDFPPLPQLPLFKKPRYLLFNITAPPMDDGSILFITDRCNPLIILCHLREKKWFVCDYPIEFTFKIRNFVSLNGIVYGLTIYRELFEVIFEGDQVTMKLLDVQTTKEMFLGYPFLVESKGELYVVSEVQISQSERYKGFSVVKMDFSKMQWEVVCDLGDQVFFLDYVSMGFSCDANESVLTKNCIYLVGDYNYCKYNLNDRSITMLRPLRDLDLENLFHPPLWVSTQCIKHSNSNNCAQSLENNPEYRICSENVIAAPEQLHNQVIRSTSQQEELWPDLLPELVLQIVHHLAFLDSRCISRAIPRWIPTIRSTQKPIVANCNHESPCLLSFSNDYKTCRLFDPLRNINCLIKTPNVPTDVKILSCKHGWLLLMLSCHDIIFYNPLSKVVIEIPPLEKSSHFSFSFSSPPTSSNCVVVGIKINKYERKIIACNKGDREWTDVLVEPLNGGIRVMLTSAVIFRDRFHWLGSDGQIIVLDPITREWDVRHTGINVYITRWKYLVESDNELFYIVATQDGDSIFVYKFDELKYAWKKTENLDGRWFFLSQEGSIGVSASVVGYKKESLYFPMFQHEQFVYYSMEARKIFPNGDLFECKELLHNSCWIELQWAQHSSEELCWF